MIYCFVTTVVALIASLSSFAPSVQIVVYALEPLYKPVGANLLLWTHRRPPLQVVKPVGPLQSPP